MPTHTAIHTDKAPKAIGPYSQAVKAGNSLYISGQIPLDPATMEITGDSISEQAQRAFNNLAAIAEKANYTLDDAVKITVYLVNLEHFPRVNDVMESFFNEPFPARACVEVSALPRKAMIEVDAILVR